MKLISQTKNILSHLPLLCGTLLPLVFIANAQASTQIQAQAIALKVIPTPNTTWNCLACHNNGSDIASQKDLKPGYSTAYQQDRSKLTKLKLKLNELPSTSVGLNNSGLAKVDIYQVLCTSDAVSLEASVRDKAPVKLPIVSAQVTKGASVSAVANDAVDGDANFSPLAKLTGGANATYSVKINKSAYTGTVATHKGAELYDGKLACRNKTGVQTGLAWRIIQNQ